MKWRQKWTLCWVWIHLLGAWTSWIIVTMISSCDSTLILYVLYMMCSHIHSVTFTVCKHVSEERFEDTHDEHWQVLCSVTLIVSKHKVFHMTAWKKPNVISFPSSVSCTDWRSALILTSFSLQSVSTLQLRAQHELNKACTVVCSNSHNTLGMKSFLIVVVRNMSTY